MDWSHQKARVEREDLVMFINACLTCTGQREFYDTAYGQQVSMDFLHDYILGNYRILYARTLAAGINHFNQGQIILKLLATGRLTPPAFRQEEGCLIAATLKALPSQRGWRILQQLRRLRINNRRARAIVRQYLAGRPDLPFQAVKYRAKVRAVAIHSHLRLPGEVGPFLFRHWQKRSYETPLFESFRQAYYSAEAVYELPYSIAEGLASKHRIPRDVFLTRIQSQMTQAEKLRLQQTAERTGKKGVDIELDLQKLPLTKLALYVLTLPFATLKVRRDEFEQALTGSARRVLRHAPLQLGKVAAVLDCSYSSSGSSQKRRRPLGVALASHFLLLAASREYRAFWTIPVPDPILMTARGQSDLATPLLMALEWGAELIVIVSDGAENDPPGGVAAVMQVLRTRLDPEHAVSVIHANPVFQSEDFSLKSLSPWIPTVGVRDAEDLPTMLGFARFADGSAPLPELEAFLAQRVQQLLKRSPVSSSPKAEWEEIGSPPDLVSEEDLDHVP